MSVIEGIAALLGAIAVWLVVKRNIWNFPIGIVMVSLYAYIFWEARLYSDMGLQVVYILLQAQGWYLWSKSDHQENEKIKVFELSREQWGITLVVLVIGTGVIGYVMSHFTDASLPWLDAFTTSMSLTAQWWLNRQYLQSWVLWIFVDIVYLYQYSVKELYVTTALYAVFTMMAIIGYRQWKANLLNNNL